MNPIFLICAFLFVILFVHGVWTTVEEWNVPWLGFIGRRIINPAFVVLFLTLLIISIAHSHITV